ncbi:MAG TPA: diguanylate cyclase [Alicycliphilus sp.]|nr:diguanylate cyclase [Alicycliphilus sp.]
MQRFRREWWWLALGALLTGALLAAGLWHERRQIEARERRHLEQQAHMLHDNLVPQLGAINHVLASLQADVPRWRQRAGGVAELNQRLQLLFGALPGVRSLNVLDAQGRVQASSHGVLLGQGFGHRAYVQHARDGLGPDTLLVSQPFEGALGGWVLVLARSLTAADGSYDGLLTASLNPEYLHVVLQSVRYADDLFTALAHGDGQHLMAVGDASEPAGRNLAQPGGLFGAYLASGRGDSVLRGPLRTGGADYLAAMRSVQPPQLHMDRPLVVTVGRGTQAVWAPWNQRALFVGLVYLLSGLALATGLLALQRRQWRLWQIQELLDRQQAVQRQQEDMLRRLADNLPGLLYQWQMEPDGRGHFPYVSPGVADIFGRTPEAWRADAAALLAHIHPANLAAGVAAMQESARTLGVWQGEYRVDLPGRGERWLSCQARPQRLEGGAVLWHGYVQDVTEAKQQANELQDKERLLRHLMEQMPIGLCLVDEAGRIYFRNQRFADYFGYPAHEELTLQGWWQEVYPDADYRASVLATWNEALAYANAHDGAMPSHEYRVATRYGTQRTMAIGGIAMGAHFMASFIDLTEQKAHNDLLRHLAFVDGITGIANRRLFDEALQREWRDCLRKGAPLALLMFDIDHFKAYNDLYGHQRGDACIKAVAAVLSAGLGRAHDLAARYGGEEFVCLLPDCGARDALAKAQELCQAVRALGLVHRGSPVAPVVTLSAGVACLVPDEHSSPETLLARADASLYRAKFCGRDRVDSDLDILR